LACSFVVQFAWPHPSALRHIVVALAQRGQIAEYALLVEIRPVSSARRR